MNARKTVRSTLAGVAAVFVGLSVSTTVAVADTEELVYVNGVNGNDANDGTKKNKAVKTLEKAQDLLRQKNAKGITVVDTVKVASDASLALSENQSLGRIKNFDGVAFEVAQGASLTINGGEITGQGSVSTSFISANNADVVLDGVRAHDLASQANGAVVNISGGSLNVKDSKFSNNSGLLGGVVYVDGAAVSVSGSEFTANKARTNGSDNDVNNAGGAFFVASTKGDVEFKANDSSFTSNDSTFGGAIAFGVEGKGDLNPHPTKATLTKTDFDKNTANLRGGAIYVARNAQLTVVSGDYTSNKVTDTQAADGRNIDHQGGAIYVEGADKDSDVPAGHLFLKNVEITKNVAVNGGGGGIAFCPTGVGSTSSEDGALIYGNEAKHEKAKDIRINAWSADSAWAGNLSEKALGDIANKWTVIRGYGSDNPVEIEPPSSVLAAKYVYGAVNGLTADEAASVKSITTRFVDNSAELFGGALAVNGYLTIGKPSTVVEVVKADALDETLRLAGAEFNLKGDNYDATYVTSAEEATLGVLAFTDLANGEYILTETKVPEGYAETQASWKLVVGDNGVTLTDITSGATQEYTDVFYSPTGDRVYSLTILNSKEVAKDVELPKTGTPKVVGKEPIAEATPGADVALPSTGLPNTGSAIGFALVAASLLIGAGVALKVRSSRS